MGYGFVRSIALLFILSLLGCRQQPLVATSTAEPAGPTTTTAPTSTPTMPATEPPPTATPQEEVAAATPTSASETPTATPLAEPVVEVEVLDGATGDPVGDARVTLVNEELGYEASFVTRASTGTATFTGAEPTTTSVYELTVSAPGFQTETLELVVERGLTEVEVRLTPGINATTTIISNLRSDPNLAAEILAEVPEGETVTALAVSEDGEWVRVRRSTGEEGWIFAQLLDFDDDISLLREDESAPPATPTRLTEEATPTATSAPGATSVPTATPTLTATATVAPTVEAGQIPPRPPATTFDAVTFRDTMVALQSELEMLGGLLDEISGGASPDCGAYLLFYREVATSPQYSDVPAGWQDLYGLYDATIKNVTAENADVFFVCQEGNEDVDISSFNRNRARSAVEQGVADLINAIRTANERLEAAGEE